MSYLFCSIPDLQSLFWTVFIKHLGDVKQIGQFIRSVIKILIHPVAVQISPALSYVILPDLYPVGIGIHIAEEAEALIVQVLVCLIIICVFIFGTGSKSAKSLWTPPLTPAKMASNRHHC